MTKRRIIESEMDFYEFEINQTKEWIKNKYTNYNGIEVGEKIAKQLYEQHIKNCELRLSTIIDYCEPDKPSISKGEITWN